MAPCVTVLYGLASYGILCSEHVPSVCVKRAIWSVNALSVLKYMIKCVIVHFPPKKCKLQKAKMS